MMDNAARYPHPHEGQQLQQEIQGLFEEGHPASFVTFLLCGTCDISEWLTQRGESGQAGQNLR
jgi:hypothetical protein